MNHCHFCGNNIPDEFDDCRGAGYACDGPKTKEESTHNTREGIEEKQKVLTSTACCRACYRQRKQLTDEIIKELEQTHHQELQKARHDWLQEEIVKLEGMKRKGLEQVEHDYITCYECGGYDECDCEGFNEALQTIIDRYLSELDQPTV